MDPKRRKIYIAIITVCFVITGGVLYWGFAPTGKPTSGLPTPFANLPNQVPSGNSNNNGGQVDLNAPFSPPTIFPENTQLDFSILDEGLRLFRSYDKIIFDQNTLGRPDPFSNF